MLAAIYIQAIVAGVVGENFHLSTSVLSNPGPGSDPQGLHRDDGMFPLPRPRMPMLCNSLLALDDVSQANGGTWLCAGSQLWEVCPSSLACHPSPKEERKRCTVGSYLQSAEVLNDVCELVCCRKGESQ